MPPHRTRLGNPPRSFSTGTPWANLGLSTSQGYIWALMGLTVCVLGLQGAILRDIPCLVGSTLQAFVQAPRHLAKRLTLPSDTEPRLRCCSSSLSLKRVYKTASER